MPRTGLKQNVIPLPRKASRDVRRKQIIDATIDTLARRGIAQATLSDVAATAGISHGLVIFHFQSKDNLLAATLEYLSEEYQQNWMAALAAADDTPACKLDALIRADYTDLICDPRKLVAWCAFWGEAQSRPFYQEHNGTSDDAYILLLESLCAELIAEAGYDLDPARAARVLRVTGEGVWLDLLSMKSPYSRAEGLKTVYMCAAALFPQHFGGDGLVKRADGI
jgi:AcrR family transcriptional regulator